MVVLKRLNNEGSMLVDSLLGLAVMTICGLLLLPIYIGMMHYEERQQAQLHASQVLYSAAHFVKQRQQTEGQQIIDGRRYAWLFHDNQLCVSYMFDEQEVEKCVSKMSAALP